MAQSRTKLAQAKFLKAYVDNYGIISRAAKAAGIHRRTFYVWKEDEDFLSELEIAEEEAKDKLEFAVFDTAVQRANPTLLIFLSKTKLADRGYADNALEVSGEIVLDYSSVMTLPVQEDEQTDIT